MAKCIKCGKELVMDLITRGFQCVNPNCSKFEKPWTKEENIDNQTWTIEQINVIEQRVQMLESQIKDTNEKLEILLKKLKV